MVTVNILNDMHITVSGSPAEDGSSCGVYVLAYAKVIIEKRNTSKLLTTRLYYLDLLDEACQ